MTPRLVVEAGGIVGAHPGAVAAAHAKVGVDEHRAGYFVAAVGSRRALGHAGRIRAMVAGHGQVEQFDTGHMKLVEGAHLAPGAAAGRLKGRLLAMTQAISQARQPTQRFTSNMKAGRAVIAALLTFPPAPGCRGKPRRRPCRFRGPGEVRFTGPHSVLHQPLVTDTQPWRMPPSIRAATVNAPRSLETRTRSPKSSPALRGILRVHLQLRGRGTAWISSRLPNWQWMRFLVLGVISCRGTFVSRGRPADSTGSSTRGKGSTPQRWRGFLAQQFDLARRRGETPSAKTTSSCPGASTGPSAKSVQGQTQGSQPASRARRWAVVIGPGDDIVTSMPRPTRPAGDRSRFRATLRRAGPSPWAAAAGRDASRRR